MCLQGELQGKSEKRVKKKPVPFTAGIAVRHKACVRASRATRNASHSEGRREGRRACRRVFSERDGVSLSSCSLLVVVELRSRSRCSRVVVVVAVTQKMDRSFSATKCSESN